MTFAPAAMCTVSIGSRDDLPRCRGPVVRSPVRCARRHRGGTGAVRAGSAGSPMWRARRTVRSPHRALAALALARCGGLADMVARRSGELAAPCTRRYRTFTAASRPPRPRARGCRALAGAVYSPAAVHSLARAAYRDASAAFGPGEGTHFWVICLTLNSRSRNATLSQLPSYRERDMSNSGSGRQRCAFCARVRWPTTAS